MICGHAPWATRSFTAGRLIPLWRHHSRPITMTSTTSPLCSSTYCSVFGGSIRSPFAVRMLMSLLLTWFPATPKRWGWDAESGRIFLVFHFVWFKSLWILFICRVIYQQYVISDSSLSTQSIWIHFLPLAAIAPFKLVPIWSLLTCALCPR